MGKIGLIGLALFLHAMVADAKTITGSIASHGKWDVQAQRNIEIGARTRDGFAFSTVNGAAYHTGDRIRLEAVLPPLPAGPASIHF